MPLKLFGEHRSVADNYNCNEEGPIHEKPFVIPILKQRRPNYVLHIRILIKILMLYLAGFCRLSSLLLKNYYGLFVRIFRPFLRRTSVTRKYFQMTGDLKLACYGVYNNLAINGRIAASASRRARLGLFHKGYTQHIKMPVYILRSWRWNVLFRNTRIFLSRCLFLLWRGTAMLQYFRVNTNDFIRRPILVWGLGTCAQMRTWQEFGCSLFFLTRPVSGWEKEWRRLLAFRLKRRFWTGIKAPHCWADIQPCFDLISISV